MPRVHVFLNPRSGLRQASAAQLQQLFADAGAACTVTPLTRALNLKALAAKLPVETTFVAAGGDGTVSAIANVVAGTPRRLGVLPLGTLNHFARDLQVPPNLPEAVAVAAGDSTRAVDVAQVNGCVFINNASLGAYPRMVVDRERMKKSGRNKWASLVLASLRAFVRFKRLELAVEIEGEHRRCTIPFLFAGNNEYCLDGLDLGRRMEVDRGVLGLYLAPGASRIDILRMAAAAILGRIREVPLYQELLVPDFTVRSGRRRLRIALDGEVRHLLTPLAFRSLPGALHVLTLPSPAELSPLEPAP